MSQSSMAHGEERVGRAAAAGTRPRDTRRWLVGAVLALVASLVASGAMVLRGAQPQQRQRLPNGGSIALLGWTYGRTHRFVLGAPWQRALYRVVPTGLRDCLGLVTFYRLKPIPNSLVLWATVSGADPNLAFGSDTRLTAADDTGEEVTVFEDRRGGAYGLAGRLRPNEKLITMPLAVDTFPRRGGMLRVRLYLRDGIIWRRGAEFVIPNPDPGPHPVWTAPPLPVRARRDRMTFSLTAFDTGARRLPGSGPASPLEDAVFRASFRIEQDGKLADGWDAHVLDVSDAFGESWEPMHAGGLGARGTERSDITGRLSTAETYRIHTEFTKDLAFPRELNWEIEDVPIPFPGARVALSRSARRDLVRLTLNQVQGAGGPLFEGAGTKIDGPAVRVAVSPSELAHDRVKLLAAVDQAGHNLLVQEAWSGSNGEEVTFELKRVPGSRAARLVFGVRKSYLVDFLARPVRAR